MNLDRRIDRRGTASLKWDFQKSRTGMEGLLPLWVADMDFPSPRQVRAALRRRVRHGIYGYTLEPESWYQAAAEWTRARHGWDLQREWLLACPGVVPSLTLAILAFTQPGDGVVIQPPVYYPFASSIRSNAREVLENPLRLEGGGYTLDLEQLEASLSPRARMILLCSPHNPVARVWRREELEGLAEVCLRRGLIVVSDEIHCDLVFPGHRHLPTAALSGELARRTVTLLSPTKTFNLAGLGGSLAVIADPELRGQFRAAKERLWSSVANACSVVSAEAAWRHGAPWLERVLAYVAGNYRFLQDFLAARLPAARAFPLEGTYLAWLDFRALGLTDAELKRRILRGARVWLDDGPMFGTGGRGFQRLNLACPRATLQEALRRMAAALS
jgi:cystathionine beta-lyase